MYKKILYNYSFIGLINDGYKGLLLWIKLFQFLYLFQDLPHNLLAKPRILF